MNENRTKTAAINFEGRGQVHITYEGVRAKVADVHLQSTNRRLASADMALLDKKVIEQLGCIIVGPSASIEREGVYFIDRSKGRLVITESGNFWSDQAVIVLNSAVEASKAGRPLLLFYQFGLNLIGCSEATSAPAAYINEPQIEQSIPVEQTLRKD